jgi:hypothetical protein
MRRRSTKGLGSVSFKREEKKEANGIPGDGLLLFRVLAFG